MIVSMALQGRAVRSKVEQRGEPLVVMTPRVILTMLCTLPLTQSITLLANIHALIARPVTWRGLTYKFGRNPKVTLVHEVPVANLGHEYNAVVLDKAA